MKLEIYKENQLINIENLAVTDFGDFIQSQVDNRKNIVIDFSSINVLKGEKNIIEQVFQDEKKEILV